MTFFYNLNDKLNAIREKPETTHKQLNERDMSRAAKGIKKYTQPGMEELSRLGREGASEKKMDAARKKYDQYDNTEVDEGQMLDKFVNSKIGQKILGKPSDANKLSPSTAGHSFGKGQATPGGPLGQIARYNNMNKNEGAHSQDAMALNPDFDKIGRKPGVMDRVVRGAKKAADVLAPGDEELLRRLEKSSGAAPRQPRTKEPKYMEAMSPAKQKSFAALAPPNDKITFADKIAGAKKEVDEMLGDVAAEAMKSALGKGKQPVRGMGEATKEIPGGRRHTAEPGGYGRKDDDDAPRVQTQRGRGRPKNNADSDTGQVMKPDFGAFGVTGKDIKLPKHKGAVTKHKMVGEDDLDPKDPGEYDQEGDMAKDTIKTVVRHAQALEKILGNNDNLPEWVQSKLAKIESMMTAVDDYMQNQETDQDDEKMQEASFPVPPGYPAFKKKKPAPSVPPTKDNKDDEEKPIAEKAVSKKQQRFMGMVSAAKKGEKPASKEVAKVAKTMKKSDAEDFASTKHKGLPEKAKESDKADSSKKVSKRSAKSEEKVEETTVSGSVATAPAAGGKKSSGGFNFGGGIYDSMNRDLENMISESMSRLDESMSINMSLNSDAQDGQGKSLTVTATGDDADNLAQMLKMAGMGSDHNHDQAYSQAPHMVDENKPDYPTNTETSNDAFQYSGGLNKPKSTGQTTIPVIASQDDRQESYAAEEEDAIKRMMEMAGMSAAGGASAGDYIDYVSASGEQPPEDLVMQNGVEYDPDTNVISVRNATSLANTHRAIAAAGWKKQAAGARPNPAAAGQAMQAGDTAYQLGEQDAIDRMMEMAGVKKKAVDEEKTDEGNLFTKGLADDNVKVGDKIPGTNAVKKKDIDESIFAMTANLWKSYKGQ